MIQCNVLYSYSASSLLPSIACSEKKRSERAESADSQWDSADCQTRKLPSCAPLSLPAPFPLPALARSRRLSRPSSGARCKQGQCGGSPATDYRESLSFAGRSVVVILGVARPRPIKLQTHRNRNALRCRCILPSFPTRQRGRNEGSRSAIINGQKHFQSQ